MTYAVAVRLQRGLVFAADTRTNAGIDNVSQTVAKSAMNSRRFIDCPVGRRPYATTSLRLRGVLCITANLDTD